MTDWAPGTFPALDATGAYQNVSCTREEFNRVVAIMVQTDPRLSHWAEPVGWLGTTLRVRKLSGYGYKPVDEFPALFGIFEKANELLALIRGGW